jgi:two-component system heavy metal sensor histidine kinase CusS
MKFRTRLAATLSALTAVTVAASFTAASFVVNRSEERQLDDALRAEARQEAAEASEAGGRTLRISDRGGPQADDVGRLTKLAAIYAPDGSIVDRTENLAADAPPLASLPPPGSSPFDLRVRKERLRATVVPIGGAPGHVLLLAASREDLEKDEAFLRSVMLVAALFSIAASALVTWRVVQRLTRGHMAIAEAAHRVAAGDLDARVRLQAGDDEVLQLARDVDEMVQSLSTLVDGQRRFVAYAAHELRSPLTTLYGELQHALRKPRSADEYRLAIEEALEAARRLKALSEDLLTVARAGEDAEDVGAVALGDAARRAADWVRPDAERRGVAIAIEGGDVDVQGNALELERLVRNLLDNAVRLAPEGTRVVVAARKEDGGALLTVTDEGPGVAEEDRARVFEPFFRAASERTRPQGSGLGLAIVREIARSYGGDAHVESGPYGKGARFVVRLRGLERPRAGVIAITPACEARGERAG